MNRTSSVPKSVLRYLLDMVRCFSLETYLIPILFSQIKRLMDEIELNSLSLLLQYEIQKTRFVILGVYKDKRKQ